MAAVRFGNTGASSLLRAASSIVNKQQQYDDTLQGYLFDLSAKTPEDFKKYQDYLTERINKTNDPNKALTYQKTLTSAYRTFNSSEIARQSLSVNYGDITNTDKYNRMFSLYQAALGNGDYSLAQSIESQMAGLSKTIQDEASAAAKGARSAAASGVAATKTQLNQLEAEVDRAYQTGQPLVVNGQEKYLNSSDYALNRAAILKANHDILSQQAADDPKYADDLARLEKSTEWRGLIDSGAVQFDQNGQAIATDKIKNLAVSFKKDEFGNNYRDFTAVPTDANGNQQNGLIKPEVGSSKQLFVADRQLNSTLTDPSLKARVAYDVNPFQQNDKNVQGVGTYNDLISGNKVLVQTEGDNKGLRATAYNGNKEQRTTDQAAEDLKALVNAKQYQPGPLDPLFDEINGTIGNNHILNTAAKSVGSAIGGFNLKKEVGNLTHFNAASIRPAGALDLLFKRSGQEAQKRAIAEAAARAEQARQQQAAELSAAYARQQAQATSAASRAATVAGAPKSYVPTAAKGQVYLPTPVGQTPAQTFDAAKKAGSSTAGAIGKAVGYNF